LTVYSIECNNKYLSLTAKIVLVLKEYSKDYGINAENLPTKPFTPIPFENL
jgi:hypothetical protein